MRPLRSRPALLASAIALLTASCGGPLWNPFVRPLPQPVPAGEGLLITGGDSADRARALADYHAAVEIHERLFGGSAPPMILVLGSPAQIARFDTRSRIARGFDVQPVQIGPDGWSSSTTRHEICHDLHTHRAGKVSGATVRFTGADRALDSYASSVLPDWFDEAGAVMCEDEADVAQRDSILVAQWQKRLPLGNLFSMNHPSARRLTGSRSRGVSVSSRRIEDALLADTLMMFYSQSSSVTRFLLEQQGPAFLPRLMDHLARGVMMDSILRTAPRPFASVTEFQTAWEGWFTSPRPSPLTRRSTSPPPPRQF
jgi:hypothetical protein